MDEEQKSISKDEDDLCFEEKLYYDSNGDIISIMYDENGICIYDIDEFQMSVLVEQKRNFIFIPEVVMEHM